MNQIEGVRLYLTREQWNHLQQESDPLMAAIYAERERITRTVVKKSRKKVTKKRRVTRRNNRDKYNQRRRDRQRYEERRYRQERRDRDYDRERRRRNNNAAAGIIIGGIAGGIVACKITKSC